MKTPRGFRFAGVNAGIKPQRKDVALVFSETPCAGAGCFTVNKAKAAPVRDAEARLPANGLHAVILNAGNANALTGQEGAADVVTVRDAAAAALKVPSTGVVTASTGVIGVRLPAHKIVDALPSLVASLRADCASAAEAIMTTDTRIKMTSRGAKIGGRDITVAGFCKGAGMIAPQMATMLAVITTDLAIEPVLLNQALHVAVERSFHNLVVDGDMSTNDAVFALANGEAKNAPITAAGPDYDRFLSVLCSLCEEMAKDIAQDGEGATKLFTVVVTGAPTYAIAHDCAKSIAVSPLVKSAVFGNDPNWGRVLATVGARAGSQNWDVDPTKATVAIQGLTVYQQGPVDLDKAALRARMREPEVKATVELNSGSESCTVWGCDLTYDYVKINADYTSLIVTTPTGGTAKDDRLTNYSPSFKRSLLVEALNYIQRFAGQRCVIKYGGAAMVKESLKRSLCDDVNLLRSLGLKPVVVHGGGPELEKALQRAHRLKVERFDGIRPINAQDLMITEQVVGGTINSELVTLLNQRGSNAVGLSGKDGGLLKARKLVGAEGRDLGHVGELMSVNKQFLEMLLDQNYVPVISPIGLGDDGQTYDLITDEVAASIAVALGAKKLIFLTNVAGILEKDELLNELSSTTLSQLMERGAVSGGMLLKARAILHALSGGVERVHVIDGRTPHTLISELFTDNGVGTLVTQAGAAS